jgi:hypothetical protein
VSRFLRRLRVWWWIMRGRKVVYFGAGARIEDGTMWFEPGTYLVGGGWK